MSTGWCHFSRPQSAVAPTVAVKHEVTWTEVWKANHEELNMELPRSCTKAIFCRPCPRAGIVWLKLPQVSTGVRLLCGTRWNGRATWWKRTSHVTYVQGGHTHLIKGERERERERRGGDRELLWIVLDRQSSDDDLRHTGQAIARARYNYTQRNDTAVTTRKDTRDGLAGSLLVFGTCVYVRD